MPIPPIGALGGAATSGLGSIGSSASTGAATGIGPAGPDGPTTTGTASGGGFESALTGAVDNLQQLQTTSDVANIKAVTGNLDDIQQATIAAARVQTTVQVVAAVRNQAVDAFNQIMRMGA